MAGVVMPVPASKGATEEEESSSSYLLQWQNFSATLASSLAESFQSSSSEERELFSDVTLVAAAGSRMDSFPAHRLVLSAGSPFFKELLAALPRSSDKHPVVIIHEVGREDLESVLQFLYLGRVSVAQSSLPSFLRAAEALRIRGLFSNDRAAANAEQDAEERTRGHKRKTPLEADGCSKRASPESKAGRPVGPKGEGDGGEEEAEELPTMKCEPADVVETSWGDGDEVEDEEGGENQRGKNQHRGQVGHPSPLRQQQQQLLQQQLQQQQQQQQQQLVVLYSEKGRCHFCRLLCPDRDSLRLHLQAVHQPPRHALCENCENFFHVCAITRHKAKCPERYTRKKEDEEEEEARRLEMERQNEGEDAVDDWTVPLKA